MIVHDMYAACRVLNSVICDVGGRECVVVVCGSGEVYVCALDEKGITLAATIELGAKVSQFHCLCSTVATHVHYPHRSCTSRWWQCVEGL